jgi:hypothetical protein
MPKLLTHKAAQVPSAGNYLRLNRPTFCLVRLEAANSEIVNGKAALSEAAGGVSHEIE